MDPSTESRRRTFHGSRDDGDLKHTKKNNLSASKDIPIDKKFAGELKQHEDMDKKVRFQQEHEIPHVDKMFGIEQKHEPVYEVKPYFSHSILQATMLTYIGWTVLYLFYRGVWTLNKTSIPAYIFSVLFLFVEVVSFFTTSLHFNNFTNPQTNILLQKLPEILAKQKKDFPPVAAMICCYKEPQHIVSRTLGTAMGMLYPPDKLMVGLLDDSSNFRESRGWVHVQSVEKNFMEHLLKACIGRAQNPTPPVLTEDEDPRGVLAPALARIQESTSDAISAEIQWFLEYLLLNTWSHATEVTDRTELDADNERELIAELRADEFSPFRTFTEEDLDCISRFSVEGLQLLWHGSAFFRPLVRCALFQRAGVRNYVRKLNETNELRYLTPAAIALARYRCLFLGREDLPNDVVSAGNVRLDFETCGTVLSPRGVYIRRRKPPVPHNKAGNINNVLFNESTPSDFEYVLLLDADQQPHVDFLQRTLPYFFSEKGPLVAWVQTPQFFSNIYPADDPLGHRNMEFYGPVAEGRGAHGACPFVGTNAVFSRKHLCEVGGIMYNSVTEDMYTGMKLHAAGLTSMYHNEILAIGSAPVDLKETLEQRKRWAQGAVEIFSLTPWGFLIKTIGLRKALFYLDSCIYPFSAPTAFFYGISPFLMALWTVPIVVDDPVLFILVGTLPVMVLPRVINYMLLRAQRPHEDGRSAPALWIEANDLWRAEQTFFSFAGTYISAWHAGRSNIKILIKKYNVRSNLAMWNWNRDFLKPKPGDAKKPRKKINEQSFRTSLKDTDTIKNTSLFMANICLFVLNILAIALACLRFNCDASQIWLLTVVVGFAFSTCWHLWSFIPMALRQNESQWPYASSYHAHNLLIMMVSAFLVFLFVKVRLCIYQYLE